MALIQVNMMSKALMRTVSIQVILPVDNVSLSEQEIEYQKPFKTLYLLHGIFGNYTDWVSGTCIQRWAEGKNLAVVMPSGDNKFYIDNTETHDLYGEFIGKELVELTRRMFPLSHKREDTYIGGLSMGGYGAFRNGLKYCDTFSSIVAMSTALVVDNIEDRTNDTPFFIESKSFAEGIFGDLSKVHNSDKDIRWLASYIAKQNKNLPKIYMTCGTEDTLLSLNRKFKDYLKSLKFDVTYEEETGSHDWDFWNKSIKRILDWLPLEENISRINSGNVEI